MKKSPKSENVTELFLRSLLSLSYLLLVFAFIGLIYGLFGDPIAGWFRESPPPPLNQSRLVAEREDWDKVENGIHVQTGLVYGDGFEIVRGTCTACHSAKLVTQNRATRQGWKDMIVWMQETQGLWDLGANEPVILDYLARHYAPEEIGRRKGFVAEEIEWYILKISTDNKESDAPKNETGH